MEAKEAYQQLLDESQGRGSKTNFGSGGRSSSASTNSSSWGYRDTTASRGAANQQSSQRRQQPPEETYSFGGSRTFLCSRSCNQHQQALWM